MQGPRRPACAFFIGNKACHPEAKRGKRRLGKTVEAYTAAEIDFLVAHIVPEDAWYVIPVAALMQRKTLRIYPEPHGRGEYCRYHEAWQQLARRSEVQTKS